MTAPIGPNISAPTFYLFPEEFNEEFRVKLIQYLNQMAESLNAKESAYFVDQEILIGGGFIPTFSTDTPTNKTQRAIYRKTIDFGALPDTATKSVAHGITTTEDFSFVNIYATATDPGVGTITEAIPIPFVSAAGTTDIEIIVDATNINITTTSNRTSFTRSFVILEYIKTI